MKNKLWWLIPDVYYADYIGEWGYSFCGFVSYGCYTKWAAYRKAYRRWITAYLWDMIRANFEA